MKLLTLATRAIWLMLLLICWRLRSTATRSIEGISLMMLCSINARRYFSRDQPDRATSRRSRSISCSLSRRSILMFLLAMLPPFVWQ